MIDAEGKRRRVKAARALGGFKSTKALAAKINQPKMSAGSLRTKEGSAGDEFTRPELREIAAACGLPYEFFEIDFAQLPELMKLATRRADAPPPAPPGELGRRGRGTQPTPQDHQPPGTNEAEDSQRGTGGS